MNKGFGFRVAKNPFSANKKEKWSLLLSKENRAKSISHYERKKDALESKISHERFFGMRKQHKFRF